MPKIMIVWILELFEGQVHLIDEHILETLGTVFVCKFQTC
jgi:hypothetical protein